jgi:hypothetical protein
MSYINRFIEGSSEKVNRNFLNQYNVLLKNFFIVLTFKNTFLFIETKVFHSN